jgi:hypothetical protein
VPRLTSAVLRFAVRKRRMAANPCDEVTMR